MDFFISFLKASLLASWSFLQDASFFFLVGLVLAGFIKLFISQEYVTTHLGTKSFFSIFKAALIGIPLPLCSCSVLPVAASLKKQGANKGAISAFLISTPESGVDSILISLALLDPILTVSRVLAAFVSAVGTGLMENFITNETNEEGSYVKCSCAVNCKSDVSSTCSCNHNKVEERGIFRRLLSGLYYSFFELWLDIAPWFFAGVILAGIISSLVPDSVFQNYLGSGISAMFLMLLFGIPIYICASASTPIAAAMILKGMSPGAALVFLLVGPATNITSLSVLYSILGKKGAITYLLSISFFSVCSGIMVDWLYYVFNISVDASIGKAAQVVPEIVMTCSAVFLISVYAIYLVYWQFCKKNVSFVK